jgi:hypothetical protein
VEVMASPTSETAAAVENAMKGAGLRQPPIGSAAQAAENG